MKLTMRTIPLVLILLLGTVKLAHAQSVSAYIGGGTATDKSFGQGIDYNGFAYSGPSLSGFFMKFGADFMLREHLGVGGEFSWRASQGNYDAASGVTYRPEFYDFNAIYHPLPRSARVVPELQGGLGGAEVKYYLVSGCALSNTACAANQYFSSSNHFQLHGSAGVRFYVAKNFYIRPQVDIHWVHNFVEFGSDWVPEYGAVIGYTFGR